VGTTGAVAEHQHSDLPCGHRGTSAELGVLRVLYTSPGGRELVSLTAPLTYLCAACGMPVDSPVAGREPAGGWVCPGCFAAHTH
jgi:hypothetical protein